MSNKIITLGKKQARLRRQAEKGSPKLLMPLIFAACLNSYKIFGGTDNRHYVICGPFSLTFQSELDRFFNNHGPELIILLTFFRLPNRSLIFKRGKYCYIRP